jgi:hypothetical protein
MTHLELFHIHISQYELYRKDDALVDELLRDMATERIVHISEYISERHQHLLCHSCFMVPGSVLGGIKLCRRR